MNREKQLETLISEAIHPDFTWQSRCHPLAGYIPPSPEPCWIKREDELNPTAIGSKQRKYLSLLPYLHDYGCKQVILIGGHNSNNVLGLAQLLRSLAYEVHALVKTPRHNSLEGNWLLLNLLLPPGQIHLCPAENWSEVTDYARQLESELRQDPLSIPIIPEGGDHPAVLPGILSIALDLIRNEARYDRTFMQIWTDAGTGISAIGLILGLHFLQQVERTVHVTLIAGNSIEFEERYDRYQKQIEEKTGITLKDGERPGVVFHRPATAASFGSMNQTVLTETREIARQAGILMDPVYSVKHFYTVKQTIGQYEGQGTHLVMYNGAAQGLNGFQNRLASIAG